jgi:hypothetical protein
MKASLSALGAASRHGTLLCVAVGLASCGSTAGTNGGAGREGGAPPDAAAHHDGAVSGHDGAVSLGVPTYHRPNDSQCLTSPPAGDCSPPPPAVGDASSRYPCTSDMDCTGGTNGRCNPDGPIAGCHCAYDTCTVDTDCPTDQLCVCHGSAYDTGAGNTCMAGNCRVDSDCGADGYCSPSPNGGCGYVGGYYCHTASDTCVDDTQCNEAGGGSCVWSSPAAHWECQPSQACE